MLFLAIGIAGLNPPRLEQRVPEPAQEFVPVDIEQPLEPPKTEPQPQEEQPDLQPDTPVAHTPEQHSELVPQPVHRALHVAAWAGVGAMIDVTSGIAIAAPMPMRRTASRRDMRGMAAGHSTRSSSKWSRESASIASQTNSWPTFMSGQPPAGHGRLSSASQIPDRSGFPLVRGAGALMFTAPVFVRGTPGTG